MRRRGQTCLFLLLIFWFSGSSATPEEKKTTSGAGILHRQIRGLGQQIARLGSASAIDSMALTDGILLPTNIAIHVFQNFFNFAVSTAAWLMVSFFSGSRGTGRSSSSDSFKASSSESSYYFNPYEYVQPFQDAYQQWSGSDQNQGQDHAYRKKRSEGQDDQEGFGTQVKRVLTGKRLAGVLRGFADTAENFDRYFDEL